VIAAPTETVYGLMTLWGNEDGRERIFLLKDRPADKRLQMLAPDLELVAKHSVVIDPRLRALAQAFWPGPLTVVCPAAPGGSVGVRLPDHEFTRELLGLLGVPLAATSANRSGRPPAFEADQAVAGLLGKPDLLVDGGRTAGLASTVVSLLAAELEILRPGPISEEALRETLAGD